MASNLVKEILSVEVETKTKLHLSFSQVINKIKDDIIENS